ncbi:MAG: GNAT family N-acetyltransferase [Waterburya sp.]
MQIIQFQDSQQFYQRVENYLLNQEATHCLLLFLSKALSTSQPEREKSPYLAIVENQQEIAATAIQTPPRPLILSQSTDLEAVNLLARDLASHNQSLSGVMASKPEAITFARTWQSLTGQSFQLKVALQVHQLGKETVQPITKASGNLRLVTESDRNLLVNWGKAFEQEALGDDSPELEHQSWFNKHLKNKSLYVWQDQVVVSMAAFGGATPNGIRVNAVYTPPEYRGKGYATSCVATVSQYLLTQGYRYCFLFTDLANPTSNHIYHQIGYRPIRELSHLTLL